MQPTTFEELKTLTKFDRLGNDKRSEADTRLYEAYQTWVPDQVKDQILELQILENQNRYKIYTTGYTVNLFNYRQKLENLPLVKHCNLWFTSWDLDHDTIEKEASNWIKAIYGERLEFCFFVNKPQNRSIGHKPHAHLFINFENYNN